MSQVQTSIAASLSSSLPTLTSILKKMHSDISLSEFHQWLLKFPPLTVSQTVNPSFFNASFIVEAIDNAVSPEVFEKALCAQFFQDPSSEHLTEINYYTAFEVLKSVFAVYPEQSYFNKTIKFLKPFFEDLLSRLPTQSLDPAQLKFLSFYPGTAEDYASLNNASIFNLFSHLDYSFDDFFNRNTSGQKQNLFIKNKLIYNYLTTDVYQAQINVILHKFSPKKEFSDDHDHNYFYVIGVYRKLAEYVSDALKNYWIRPTDLLKQPNFMKICRDMHLTTDTDSKRNPLTLAANQALLTTKQTAQSLEEVQDEILFHEWLNQNNFRSYLNTNWTRLNDYHILDDIVLIEHKNHTLFLSLIKITELSQSFLNLATLYPNRLNKFNWTQTTLALDDWKTHAGIDWASLKFDGQPLIQILSQLKNKILLDDLIDNQTTDSRITKKTSKKIIDHKAKKINQLTGLANQEFSKFHQHIHLIDQHPEFIFDHAPGEKSLYEHIEDYINKPYYRLDEADVKILQARIPVWKNHYFQYLKNQEEISQNNVKKDKPKITKYRL